MKKDAVRGIEMSPLRNWTASPQIICIAKGGAFRGAQFSQRPPPPAAGAHSGNEFRGAAQGQAGVSLAASRGPGARGLGVLLGVSCCGHSSAGRVSVLGGNRPLSKGTV